MTDLIENTLSGLSGQLRGRVSRPGDDRYGAATAIWAKPVGPMPRTVVHCQTLQDIQLAIAAARSAGLSLSVRGGGHDWAAPLLKLGTLLDNTLDAVCYGSLLSVFDPHIVNGRRTFMETCSLSLLDEARIDVLVEAMAKAVSAGCAIFTHEFRGAATRVPVEATAFGLRRDHVLIEILASFPDCSDRSEERRHQQWVRDTRRAFDALALPGGYPNLLGVGETDRATEGFGRNIGKLVRVKQLYDPDNVFCSAIPLPIGRRVMAAE